jgi:outer membrane receptor for ferrienterochelin and colicin
MQATLQQDGLCLCLPPSSKASLAAAKADASKVRNALLAQAKQEAQAAKASIAAATRKALQEEQAERVLADLLNESAEQTTGRSAPRCTTPEAISIQSA